MTEQAQSLEDQFPTLVYKGEGPYSREGGTYDYVGVNDQEKLDAKLSDGWFTTLPEAIDANDNPVLASDENAQLTRKDLEASAKEIGIKFNKKTTDAELSAAISSELSKEQL